MSYMMLACLLLGPWRKGLACPQRSRATHQAAAQAQATQPLHPVQVLSASSRLALTGE